MLDKGPISALHTSAVALHFCQDNAQMGVPSLGHPGHVFFAVPRFAIDDSPSLGTPNVPRACAREVRLSI